jgi:hypothetical protein
MTTVEILKAARARIDTPDKWFALGHPSQFQGGNRECALIALQRATHDLPASTRIATIDIVARVMGVERGGDIAQFNNSHSHAEVLAAFDEAIAHAVAREQEFVVEPIAEPVPA